jgi:protein-tyrosine phosphatase
MPRILFVCTANLYRSPLGAALLSQKLGAEGGSRRWRVASAGTWTVPGQHVPARALAAARARGIDLSGHRTRQVDHDLLTKFDLILVMEKGHREALCIEFPFIQPKIHLLSELADQLTYDIADPAKPSLEIEEIVSEMSRLIERAYPAICRLVQPEELGKPSSARHVNFTL